MSRYGQTEDQDLNRIWSNFGLNPQQFPAYYPIAPRQFTDGQGQPSGAAGSIVRLTRSLPNFPHMFYGVRVSNVYPLPAAPSADIIQQYRAYKEWLDGEQTIRIELAQQNIVTDRTLVSQVTGTDGIHWHPFPVPFPMAGGNDISIEITRITGYPPFEQLEVLPEVHVTLVAAVLRADMRTMAPHRMPGG